MFSLTNLTPYNLLAKAVALALLVISLYAAWYNFTGHYIDIGKANVQAKWDKEKAETKILVDKQKADVATAIKAANEITKTALDEKNAALTELGLEHINRLELTKRIEALNEAHNTKLADTKYNYNERLRLEGVSSASAMREESERYKELSRGAPECDGIIADYETLKQACQLTTIDFNTCRLAYDADTVACGREK